MEDDNSESPRPTKRARRSCERCRQRKQRCQGYPVCNNCQSAKEICKQPASAIEEYRSGPNQALIERISFLEAQLAGYQTSAGLPPADNANYAPWIQNVPQQVLPAASKEDETRRGSIADIVGFLSLGAERAYVGPSSGFALASSLGQMVQATVWNKALAATVNEHQSKVVSLAEVRKNSAGPPNDDMGSRILDAYWTRTHHRYPFLDRSEIMERHVNRFNQSTASIPDQFGTFKLYMIYAIGATLLKLTEAYDYTPPESFFMTALQYISAARESHSVHNIQAMTLLVLYNLRSPSNSGIWYMIGLAMRTCVDLGLHREAHYAKISPYEGQLRRRLFWSVYFLERVIAVSLGRPYSIADRDIDVTLPLEIDDTVRDDGLIARTQAVAPSPTFQASRPSSNLTLGIQCIRLMRLESYIQSTIYRVDRPIASLVSKISPILKMLEDWHSTLPPLPPSESDYLDMHYQKAIRLSLQPFLTVLPPTDPRISLCLHASGQISQIFKRLHQRDSYGHSFIALHSVFIAGVTMCYCLFLSPTLWTFNVSNDLRACSSALFVMAERTPVVKKYRDALETVISATMEFMSRNPSKDGSNQSNVPGAPGIPTPLPQTQGPAKPLTKQESTTMGPPPPPAPKERLDSPSSQTHDRKGSFDTFIFASTSPSPRESYIRSPTLSKTQPPPQQAQSPQQPYQQTPQHQQHQQPPFASNHPQPYNNTSYGATYTPFAYEAQPAQYSNGSILGFGGDDAMGMGGVNGGGGLGGRSWHGDGGTGTQQVDAEWLLSLCEGDGFSLQMLNEMMRFEPGGVLGGGSATAGAAGGGANGASG